MRKNHVFTKKKKKKTIIDFYTVEVYIRVRKYCVPIILQYRLIYLDRKCVCVLIDI